MFRKCLLLASGLLMATATVTGQTGKIVLERHVEANDPEQGLPGMQFNYELDSGTAKAVPGPLSFRETSGIPFTGLAVGWKASDDTVDPHEFHVEIRTRDTDGDWTVWYHTSGYDRPSDSPSGLYWSHIYITEYGYAHNEFDVRVEGPDGVLIDFVKVYVADARNDYTVDRTGGPEFRLRSENDDFQPEIITRDEWWGDLSEDELEPGYTPSQITITHAIVHHTAGQNNPPDPAQVVRNIWDFHVNGRGWLDIGYNFLVDQFGNIYQGRYNPWLDETDIHAAHAGDANSKSVGIAILGQFHPPESNPPAGHPDERSVISVEDIIAWRFHQRGLDPLENAAISSVWGTVTIPRISGHRDVSATACPGDNLWDLLPDIRQNVAELIFSVPPESIAEKYILHQNYPNPFNPSTTIWYTIPDQSSVTIEVFNTLGHRVQILVDGEIKQSGHYEVVWDGSDKNRRTVASGLYLYRMTAGEFSDGKYMLFLK